MLVAREVLQPGETVTITQTKEKVGKRGVTVPSRRWMERDGPTGHH